MSFYCDSTERIIPDISLDGLSGYCDELSESIVSPLRRLNDSRGRSSFSRRDDHLNDADGSRRCGGMAQSGFRCIRAANSNGYCSKHDEVTDRFNIMITAMKQREANLGGGDRCRGIGNFVCQNRVEHGYSLCENCENSICPRYEGSDCSGPIVRGRAFCEACLLTKRIREMEEEAALKETQRAARRAEEIERATRKAEEEMVAALRAETARRAEVAKREAEAAEAARKAEEEAARKAAFDRAEAARKAVEAAVRKANERRFRFASASLEQRFLDLSEKRREELTVSINSFRLGSEAIDLSILGKRYREYARLHHPDKGGDEERFKTMGHHYELLKSFLEE